MEAIKDFDTFYAIKLQPVLSDLKSQAAAARKWMFTGIFSLIAAVACFIADHTDYFPGGTTPGIFLVALVIVSIYMYTKKKDSYIDNFKETVIHQIISYLQPDLIYKPDCFVSSKEYRASGLFRRRYDEIDGDDYMEGIYKNVRFHCSEIHTQYQTGLNNYLTTIFKGLFFIADVSPSFSGGTYIWTSGEEQIASSVADERYRLYPLPKVYGMKMEDPVFNKYFSVCSTNPSEARTILDTEMMQLIVKYRQQLNRRIVCSVVAGHCYVAIPIQENLLEPSDSGLENKEAIKEYFMTILLVFSIINQLHLDRLT
ncbi:MAG: DUF3137 domain-containing protein [Ferruginibacter sp.]